MRRILVVLFSLAFAQTSFGQLSGALSGSYGPGTYHVVGDISVPSGDIAQLMPGTTFLFDGSFSFTVSGTLFAEGMENNGIVFTMDSTVFPDRWNGLYFNSPSSSGSRLDYCVIENSISVGGASGYGGGVFCNDASPKFAHCMFRDNEAGYGGGVYVYLGSPTFESCTFTGNDAVSGAGGGGGVRISHTSAIFINCIFTDNSAVYGGGLFCSNNSTGSFTHCTFSDNSGNHGGAIYLYSCSPSINSVIVANSTGAGIFFNNSSAAEIEFCDFYGNTFGPVGFESYDPANGPSDIAIISGVNANGDPCDDYFNIFLDPVLVDPPNDLHLQSASACIGAAFPVIPPPFDFDGNPRPNPVGSNPDIGAFEHGYLMAPEPLVILFDAGNAVLHWNSTETTFNIYGSDAPFTPGDSLDTVTNTTWTDMNTSSRSARYFYYVTAVE